MIFPEVVDMNLPVEGAFHNLVIVSIKKQYPFTRATRARALGGGADVVLEGDLRRG
jgi:UbiD family decarboxylase